MNIDAMLHNKAVKEFIIIWIILTGISAQESTDKADSANSTVVDSECSLLQIEMLIQHQRDVNENLTSLQKNNILLELENKKLTEKLAQIEDEKLSLDLKSQQDAAMITKLQAEIDVRKDLMRESMNTSTTVNNQLTRDNQYLREQLRDCQTYRNEVLQLLKNTDTFLKTGKITIISSITSQGNEMKTFINSSSSYFSTKIIENMSESFMDQNVADKRLNFKLDDIYTQQQDILVNLQNISKMLENKYQYTSQNTSSSNSNDTKNESCSGNGNGLKTQIIDAKRYYLSFDQPHMTWSEAATFCKSNKMNLVSVETQQEWDLLKPELYKLVNKYGWEPWSSGNDLTEEGKWKWASTGSDVVFLAPKSFRNNNKNNCLYLYMKYWGDVDCSIKRPFICEC